MDRRDFVATCACALSVAALTGCASLVIRRVTPIDGRIELALSHYPELSERESSLAILPDGHDDPVYVLTDAAGEFTALSSMCTHLGCTVDMGEQSLVCPCHGSTFDRTGRVVKGPAQRNLVRFPTRVSTDGVLTIDLARGA